MINLSSKFKPIKKKDSPRYVLLTGGRGASKSFGVATLIAERACSPGHRILYTRYTMTSASLSIIPEITEKLDLLDVRDSFEVEKATIKNKINNSDIIFRGIKTSSGNQTASLKSLQGVSTWVLDEADELVDEDDFDKIDMSIRTKSQKNQIILILNPTTTEHWIWERWFENSHRIEMVDGCPVYISTHPDVLHIHFTYLDNLKHLDPLLVKLWQDMKQSHPSKYAHKIIGGWLSALEGVIYDNWKEGRFDDTLPFVYGLDYGFTDPLALVKVAVDKNKQRIYWKECGYKEQVEDVDEFLRKGGVKKNELIVADLNEKRTTQDLRRKGWNIRGAKKGKIVEGIRKVKNYELIVDPGSNNLKKELRHYVWNDKKSEVPIDDWNHALDAGRYASMRLLRGRGKSPRTNNKAKPTGGSHAGRVLLGVTYSLNTPGYQFMYLQISPTRVICRLRDEGNNVVDSVEFNRSELNAENHHALINRFEVQIRLISGT